MKSRQKIVAYWPEAHDDGANKAQPITERTGKFLVGKHNNQLY